MSDRGPLRVLALDCASKTGWAVGERDAAAQRRLIDSGVQEFDLRRGESAGLRFLRFRAWLRELRSVAGPFNLVIFEQAHHRGGAATELCVGMTTRAQEFAAEMGAEHASLHTATLKKATTGRGNAEKSDMIQAAQEVWGRRPADDNEADALCLLKYAIDNYA